MFIIYLALLSLPAVGVATEKKAAVATKKVEKKVEKVVKAPVEVAGKGEVAGEEDEVTVALMIFIVTIDAGDGKE